MKIDFDSSFQAAKAQHFAAHTQAYSYPGHLGALARQPLAPFNGIKAPAVDIDVEASLFENDMNSHFISHKAS